MTNRFLISVAAAALIAGTGFANAQGNGGMNREAPSAGAPAQHSAPSGDRGAAPSSAPMNRDSASDSRASDKAVDSTDSKANPKGMKSTESDEKMQPNGGMKAAPKGEKSAQDNNMKGEKSKSMSSETNSPPSKDMKAEGRTGNTNTNAETKTPTDSKSTTTTGNAATSANAAPPAEKRTQIVSAIRSEKITETTNVNFEINVGTRVPASVHFYPLPPRIVEIYPEWRGYEVILVNGRYVIIRPQTREIVYVIEG